MSFVHTELIEEIRHYQAQRDDLEAEDLLREIMGMKPLHKRKLQGIEERINRLCWSCQDIM